MAVQLSSLAQPPTPKHVLAAESSDSYHFDFLSLPRELRDKIYCNLFPAFVSHQDRKSVADSPCGLLMANKQIYNEFRGWVYEMVPYRLIFRLCRARCLCRGWGSRDREAAASASGAANENIEVHRGGAPVLLAPEHKKALRNINNVEILWVIPHSHGSYKGVIDCEPIIESVAESLRQSLKHHVAAPKVTFRWTYEKSDHGAERRDATHEHRGKEWLRCLKKNGLPIEESNVEVSSDNFSRTLITTVQLRKDETTIWQQ